MITRTDRLKKLVVLQDKLKALHETRHAGFLVAAVNARRDAEDLATHFDTEGSLSSSFPELYNRRIAAAVSLERANSLMADNEVKAIAEATARSNMVARQWLEASRAEERQRTEVESLEALSRKPLIDK